MFQQLLDYILSVFQMVITLFQNTDLGGFSYETVLVSIAVVTIIVRVIIVVMK